MSNKIRCDLKSWDEMRSECGKLGEEIINSKYSADIIIAVARGGLVPAMNLSDILGIKDLASIRVEHWGKTAEKDTGAVIKYGINADLSGRNVLIVDDISDTGESLKAACEYIKKLNPKEVKVAVIHYVTTSKFKPDFYAKTVDRAFEFIWIVYPWNLIEDTINLIKKLNVRCDDTDENANEIKKHLELNYKFSVDEKTLKKVMAEMKRRDGKNGNNKNKN